MLELKSALEQKRILHGGNELLGWAASNMITRTSADGRYIMPAKARSKDKIDPIVALVMAIGEAMHYANPFPSDYKIAL